MLLTAASLGNPKGGIETGQFHCSNDLANWDTQCMEMHLEKLRGLMKR